MERLNAKETIANLVKQHPEIKDILLNLGFTEIVKPQMLMTVGRFMNIKSGCQLRKIEYNQVVEVFRLHGYSLEGITNE